MPTIEKTVLVEQKVGDLWGLFMDLRRAAFKVRNVGADSRGTYVYLEPDEDKDPSMIVESWVGKENPAPSILLRNIRAKELKKVKEEEEVRIQAELEVRRKYEEAKAKGELEGLPVPVDPPQAEAAPEKIGYLKKIFRKFF